VRRRVGQLAAAGRRVRSACKRDRDRVEFVDFVTERYLSLCRTAYLLTGNHHTAEDAVQSALTKAFVHWARVRRADHPDA
jgi:DNA-directed RNA polymerase specialized sigma24 family protein